MDSWARGPASAVSVLVLMLALVSCGFGQRTPSERYEPAGPEHCTLIAFDEIIAGFEDFSLSSRHDTTGRYWAFEGYTWTIVCSFDTQAETERLATGRWEFAPYGAVTLTVHRDSERARESFEQEAGGLERMEQVSPAPDVRHPDVSVVRTVGVFDGRWDDSLYLETTRSWDEDHEHGPGSYVRFDPVLLHHNLVVRATATATFPPADREEATEIVRTIVLALIEEAVAHLTVTSDPWPSPLSPAPDG